MDNGVEQEGPKVGRIVRRPWQWSSQEATAVAARWKAVGMAQRDGFQVPG